jgi:hypothetical protein
MTGRNPWVVLGVPEDAPYHEVHSAFRRRAKQTHPDGGGDAREFETVVLAFGAVRGAARPSCRAPRSTPYDPWLRPSSAPVSTPFDRRAPGAAAPGAGRATSTVRSRGIEFGTVLMNEMSKAGPAPGAPAYPRPTERTGSVTDEPSESILRARLAGMLRSDFR